MKGSGLVKLKLKVNGLRKCIAKEIDDQPVKTYLNKSTTKENFISKLNKEYYIEEQWHTIKALADLYYSEKERLDEYKEYKLVEEV